MSLLQRHHTERHYDAASRVPPQRLVPKRRLRGERVLGLALLASGFCWAAIAALLWLLFG